MNILALDASSASTSPDSLLAGDAHAAFAAYLARTKNTICGRHPIGVLLGALTAIERGLDADQGGKKVTLRWVRYAQSSPCVDIRDSSVSYASAYVVF
jgi:MEMO1 family protein